MLRWWYVIVLTVLAAMVSTAPGQYSGYELLSDWSSLPTGKTHLTAGLASSYDRAGGNYDYNHYEWPTGFLNADLDTVVTTLAGPGAITRFWMPHATADEAIPVRITVDGVLKIDTDSDTLLGGDFGYMTAPLVSTLVGGQVSYEPIVFQNSLKIETKNYTTGSWERAHHYYQYSYHRLPPGTQVTAYSGALTPAQQAERAAAVAMIDNVGAHPGGASATSDEIETPPATIDPGGALALAELTGSGRIRRLNVKMPGASDAELDGLRLRVRYDGSDENAIDVPVAHFFGAGHGRAAYRSLPLGTDSEEGFYSYWPMPYRRGAVVELYNATGAPIGVTSAVVEYDATPVAHSEGYLHAVFDEETTASGQEHHQLLDVTGRGHYVGNLLYLQKNGTGREILEGDDIIIVDGTRVLYGTGAEDAYNGGYYYNHVLVQSDDGDIPRPESGIGPFHGLLNMDDADTGDSFVRTDQYRWMIADAVPFTDGLTVLIENFGKQADVLFGSTAFYYVLPLPGDADLNGVVDDTDLAILLGNWSDTTADWARGDFSDDGVVNDYDLSLLLSNWTGPLPVGGHPHNVPEPTALMLLALLLPLLPRRRGRAEAV